MMYGRMKPGDLTRFFVRRASRSKADEGFRKKSFVLCIGMPLLGEHEPMQGERPCLKTTTRQMVMLPGGTAAG